MTVIDSDGVRIAGQPYHPIAIHDTRSSSAKRDAAEPIRFPFTVSTSISAWFPFPPVATEMIVRSSALLCTGSVVVCPVSVTLFVIVTVCAQKNVPVGSVIVSPSRAELCKACTFDADPLDSQVAANAAGPEKPLKMSVSRSVPVPFTIAAYRRSSRFASSGDIRMDIACQHFFLRVFLGCAVNSCDLFREGFKKLSRQVTKPFPCSESNSSSLGGGRSLGLGRLHP